VEDELLSLGSLHDIAGIGHLLLLGEVESLFQYDGLRLNQSLLQFALLVPFTEQSLPSLDGSSSVALPHLFSLVDHALLLFGDALILQRRGGLSEFRDVLLDLL
jgi:hypothetical protein